MITSASGFLRELGRKVFHLLILLYLGAYFYFDRPAIWLTVWAVIVAIGETLRLRVPAINRFVTPYFSGIIRDEEKNRYSGIFHTSLGAALTVSLFGHHPRIVTGAFLCLALGDAAAALVGKAIGRIGFTVGGKVKSLEGSLACLLISILILKLLGFGWVPVLAGAFMCALIEITPLPINDNFLLPVMTGLALRLAYWKGQM